MATYIDTAYTSIACNRIRHAADWGNNNFICYAASHSVAIYDPSFSNNAGKLMSTLYYHLDRVNCVRWIRSREPAYEKEFVSASTDKCVAVWQYDPQNPFSVSPTKLCELDTSVNVCDGIYWNNGENLTTIVVAATPCSLSIWTRDQLIRKFTICQTIDFAPQLILDVKLNFLNEGSIPIVACSCGDGSVHLFTGQLVANVLNFKKVIRLDGHEDWVQAIDFSNEDNGDLLLASAAQDATIRIWRISSVSEIDQPLALQTTQGTFCVEIDSNFQQFKCSLETLLNGHENWVYGLHFQPRIFKDGKWTNPSQLLSCSMDKTMIIWSLDHRTGTWLDEVRVGEVGGNTLGFYGCRFGNEGMSILAHGYQGALHLWSYKEGVWLPRSACGGHFGSVEDMFWDPCGEFIVTVSADQTARFHAPWVRKNSQITWHEIGRPQIHGYDLSCVAPLGRFRYASGAEEKVIRVFEAPKNFRENFSRICQVDIATFSADGPEGAAVPALGLSNKPIYQSDIAIEKEASSQSDQYSENYFVPVELSEPPTEETLLQNTLWPEIHKLYGHGYELFSLATDYNFTLMASTSRAQQAEHSSIFIWDLSERKVITRLQAHALTVTQLAFSPNGQFLLSVSRDRTWAVHKRCEEDGVVTLETIEKKIGGSRILWCCDWSPDSLYFVIGSRDKRVVVWSSDGSSYIPFGSPLECSDSVTAIAFCNARATNSCYFIAVGLDNGRILIYSWTSTLESSLWSLLIDLDQSRAHHKTVKRLKFRPVPGISGSSDSEIDQGLYQLVSCGADHSLKVYTIQFSC